MSFIQTSNLKPQTSNQGETICALATVPGGALGIIRISGEKSLEIFSRIFTKDLTKVKPNTIHYGHIKNGTDIIDEVMVSVFKAPHSNTGEDSAEISCHGSRYIMNKILELLVKEGCRMAEPGEFTQRAFLNGKMRPRPLPTSSPRKTVRNTAWRSPNCVAASPPACRNCVNSSSTSPP